MAQATVGTGIEQDAFAGGASPYATFTTAGSANAHDSLTNSNTINILAVAAATASSGNALAYASVGNGIEQFAVATGLAGAASATLTNSGTIAVMASASAKATNEAFAHATIGTGIYQDA